MVASFYRRDLRLLSHCPPLERPNLEKRSQKLEHAIEDWFTIYRTTMEASIASARTTFPDLSWPEQVPCAPEDITLPLPSALPPPSYVDPLIQPLVMTELKLRRGQANDILREVRRKIGLKSFLRQNTNGQFGQSAKTRMGQATSKIDDSLSSLREQYNLIRQKLVILGEPMESPLYQPLTAHDCKPLRISHQQEAPGNKHSSVAWIWRDGVTHGDMGRWQHEGTITINIWNISF